MHAPRGHICPPICESLPFDVKKWDGNQPEIFFRSVFFPQKIFLSKKNPNIIIYVIEGGFEVPAQLFDDKDYRELLTRKGIECLENEAGVQIYGYAGLEHHGKYKRGPLIAASASAKGFAS